MSDATERHAQFVREHLRVAPVPLVPEVVIYQADRAIGLWELTENEYRSEQPPPFWAFAWAGGTGLARYLLEHPSLLTGIPVDVGRTAAIEDPLTTVRPTSTGTGRAVLDLAAGSGLVSIAAMKAGASSATAVEIDPMAGAAIALNAQANDVPVRVVLDDVLDASVADLHLPAAGTLVLAGDVFYSQQMSARMLTFLRRAARDGAEVLVGDPGRAYFPADYFTPLTSYDVPVSRELESTTSKTVTIYRINPRGAAIKA